jgi:putative ABC transport system permease protein
LENAQAAVGQIIYRPTSQAGDTPPQRLHIIGVAENLVLRPISAGAANFYLFNPDAAAISLVRIAKNEVLGALAGIDKAWREMVPEEPLKRRFASEQIEQAFQWIEVISGTFVVLAVLASAIAVMSLVGSALHAIRLRTHEIGVRKSLGASVRQILAMLLAGFSKPVIAANVAAWPIAYIVMRGYLSLFAYSDALTIAPFVASLSLALFIAWAAVIAQSVQAARLRPATILRNE